MHGDIRVCAETWEQGVRDALLAGMISYDGKLDMYCPLQPYKLGKYWANIGELLGKYWAMCYVSVLKGLYGLD